tara:strand:+ start:690 stop:932 length:243 start_codon:yes stop_codon:yes gene_type:complete
LGSAQREETNESVSDEYPSEILFVSGDKVIMDRFGAIDRIPTLFVFDSSGREAFTFVQLRGPKKIHARDFGLTRVVEKLR